MARARLGHRLRWAVIGHRARRNVAVLGLLALSSVPAIADDLALRGSAIAAEKCSRCHAIGLTDQSPHKITPPFRSLGADFPIPMLADALKTGIVGGHEKMPQFDLGVDGAKAIIAYIDGLNPGAPPHLGKQP